MAQPDGGGSRPMTQAEYEAAQYAAGNTYSTGTADTNNYAWGGAADPYGNIAPPADSGYMTQQQTVQYYADPANASYTTTSAPVLTPAGGETRTIVVPPPPPPPQSAQSQQSGAFLTWLQGGGMPTSGGGTYVSPVAAAPMIGARPGDVLDTDSNGRIDAPPPLPNTTWGGMMESTPNGGYGMPFTAGMASDSGYIAPSVTQTAPYPAPRTTWDGVGGSVPPGGYGLPIDLGRSSDPGYVAPAVTQGTNTTWGGMMASPYAGEPVPFDPNMVPGGARNTGASERVGPSAADAETWDKSSGYLSVEGSRAGYDIPGGPGLPISGPADAGQRWAPDQGPTVNWDVIEEINRRAREQPPAGPPAPPPAAPAPAPTGFAPAPGAAPAPAPSQGTPLITPDGTVYGTLSTNANGQTVVKKLPKGRPNRWNIPQLPVTAARQGMPAPQVLPPGVTQTVAPGFALPPNFLPPAWAEQAQGPAMPQLPRGNGNQQGGGGRRKDRR